MADWNLNYPTRDMFPAYGGFQPATPSQPGFGGYEASMLPAAAGVASMALPWAGFGLQAAGVAANVLGASGAAEEAEEAARRAEERYQEELRQKGLERQRQKEQDALALAFKSGDYTQNMQDDIRKRYGQYYNQVRM